MIPDSCVTAATLRTPMNVHVFPEHIVITDRKKRLLALEFQILRLKTDRPEGVKMIVVANLCWPFYNNMGFETAALPDLDSRTDPTIRPDVYILTDFGLWTYNGSRMNHGC